MARRRRGGIGLGGLLVVIALLYFTGAGAWLWQRVKSLDQNCFEILAGMGTDMGAPVCNGLGATVRAADSAFTNFSGTVDQWTAGIKNKFRNFFGGSGFGGLTNQSVSSLMQGSSPLNNWVSPSEKLAQMMNGRPMSLGGSASTTDRIRSALDSFVIGEHFLNSGGDAVQALPWLQHGAQQPGYGVMSQLALGDLYRNGASGIAANPAQARHYYQQAQQSLGILSNSNAPESAQMLQSLPASPADIQKQLTAAIGQLNKQIKNP